MPQNTISQIQALCRLRRLHMHEDDLPPTGPPHQPTFYFQVIIRVTNISPTYLDAMRSSGRLDSLVLIEDSFPQVQLGVPVLLRGRTAVRR